jgi:subtilisin family serine protease
VGPLVFEGGAFPERQNANGTSYHFTDNLSLKLGYFMIFWLVVDLITARRKSRRRRLTLYVTAILFTVFLSMMPSAQALWYSTVTIRANEVWDTGNRGAGVNVAVIDSGIDSNHPDFQGAIVHKFVYGDWTGLKNPNDTYGHGTHVAGIIAGRGIHNNNFRGVAWEAGLVIIKVTNSSDLDDAINWVRYYKNVYNIGVLSLSVAAPGTPINEDGTSSYSKAVDDAIDAGIVVVKSAGNEGPGSRTITRLVTRSM